MSRRCHAGLQGFRENVTWVDLTIGCGHQLGEGHRELYTGFIVSDIFCGTVR